MKISVTIVYIMIIMLFIVIGLGYWALQLMEQAYQRQEFSRMLAGTLVVFAAGGVLTTYFLINDYLSFIEQARELQQAAASLPDPMSWLD